MVIFYNTTVVYCELPFLSQKEVFYEKDFRTYYGRRSIRLFFFCFFQDSGIPRNLFLSG